VNETIAKETCRKEKVTEILNCLNILVRSPNYLGFFSFFPGEETTKNRPRCIFSNLLKNEPLKVLKPAFKCERQIGAELKIIEFRTLYNVRLAVAFIRYRLDKICVPPLKPLSQSDLGKYKGQIYTLYYL